MKRLLVALAFSLVATPALSQQAVMMPTVCYPNRDQLVEVLRVRQGELPILKMVTTGGNLTEVLWNEKTDAWTIIKSSATGVVCLLMTGEGLVLLPVGERS